MISGTIKILPHFHYFREDTLVVLLQRGHTCIVPKIHLSCSKMTSTAAEPQPSSELTIRISSLTSTNPTARDVPPAYDLLSGGGGGVWARRTLYNE